MNVVLIIVRETQKYIDFKRVFVMAVAWSKSSLNKNYNSAFLVTCVSLKI